MQRYICARGVPGKLCGHPQQKEGERRYLGKERLSRAELDALIKEREGGLDQADMYRDTSEVVALDDHVRKALAAGDVVQVGEEIHAHSLAAANKRFAPAIEPRAPKTTAPKSAKKASTAGGDD